MVKWKRQRAGCYQSRGTEQTWSVVRQGRTWFAFCGDNRVTEGLPTKRAAQKHCEERAAKNPVQRWFDGEPLEQLPEGAAALVLDVARRHAFVAQHVIGGLETIHVQTVESHNALMQTKTPDERQRYLALGTAHGMTQVGEACGALRDWAVGRMGK